jgi:hypothetical protein
MSGQLSAVHAREQERARHTRVRRTDAIIKAKALQQRHKDQRAADLRRERRERELLLQRERQIDQGIKERNSCVDK